MGTGEGKRADPQICGRDHIPTYIHSGAAGDLIYALPVIREHALKTTGKPLVRLILGHKVEVHHPWDQQTVENMLPLLDLQPYIHSTQMQGPNVSWNHDCDKFRDLTFRYYIRGKTITQYVCDVFGIDAGCSSKAWLTVDQPMHVEGCPVVISHTGRYPNRVFPWRKVLQKYSRRMVFVGTQFEWERFVFRYGHVPFCPTANALELARMIAGCKLFIGNQSLSYAIAESIKQNTVQEAWPRMPNCVWPRPNAWICLDNRPHLPNLTDL